MLNLREFDHPPSLRALLGRSESCSFVERNARLTVDARRIPAASSALHSSAWRSGGASLALPHAPCRGRLPCPVVSRAKAVRDLSQLPSKELDVIELEREPSGLQASEPDSADVVQAQIGEFIELHALLLPRRVRCEAMGVRRAGHRARKDDDRLESPVAAGIEGKTACSRQVGARLDGSARPEHGACVEGYVRAFPRLGLTRDGERPLTAAGATGDELEGRRRRATVRPITRHPQYPNLLRIVFPSKSLMRPIGATRGSARTLRTRRAKGNRLIATRRPVPRSTP
jgi:hypothetical protein